MAILLPSSGAVPARPFAVWKSALARRLAAVGALVLVVFTPPLALAGSPAVPGRLATRPAIFLKGLSYPLAAEPMFGRYTPTRVDRPLPSVALPEPTPGLDGYDGPNAPYVAVFVYHQVAPRGWPLTHGPDTVTPAHLALDLAYLRSHHVATLTAAQFLSYMQGDLRVPPGSVFLTFDNGLEGVWRFAFPLLEKYHAHATVFLIGGRTLESHVDGREAAYLTWPQVESMDRSGLVSFESETYSLHHDKEIQPGVDGPAVLPAWNGFLGTQPENESTYVRALERDFVLQRRAFESHLHYAPDLLVWPFSCFTEIAMRVAGAYGIEASFVVQPGFAIPGTTPLSRIPRNDVSFMDESLPLQVAALARAYRAECASAGLFASLVPAKK
jgi:peptidoglycan/xylan/chitin deacetylase (PgdA/CDA1 family)